RHVSGSLLCHGALNFQQFVRWILFESHNFSCGQGEFSQDHLGGFRRHVARRHVNARAALNRRLIEVVLCERQGIYAGGFCATPGFAKNHYVVRIPAKRVDVFVYALEGCRNVQDSLIPVRDILFSCQIRQEQVSEKSQTMIVRHYNNVVLTREVASTVSVAEELPQPGLAGLLAEPLANPAKAAEPCTRNMRRVKKRKLG